MNKKLIISLIVGLFMLSTITYADRLSDIKKRGVLVVGLKSDAKPFSYKSRSGKLIGFEVDLIKKMTKYMGVRYKFVPVTSKNRFEYVLSGKIDIALATATHTIQRDSKVDFSISYFYDGQAILSRKSLAAGSYKDLAGKRMGAVKGSTSGVVFEVIQPLAKMFYFKTIKEAVQAIYNNKIDAVTSDYGLLNSHFKDSKGKLKIVGKRFTLEPYGMSMRENESNLRDEINFAIQHTVKNGDYNKIYRKWFGVSAPRKPVLWP